MFSAKQYEIIGRLTIGFNELDFTIEIYFVLFLRAKEYRLGNAIVRKKAFSQKLQLLRDLLRQLLIQYPTLKTEIGNIETSLARAKRVSEARNRIVHGLLTPDLSGKGFVLMHNDGTSAWDEHELRTLVEDLDAAVKHLSAACYALLQLLDLLRSVQFSPLEYLANLKATTGR